MPTARGGIAAATIGTRIFVFGGEATTGTYNTAEMYDPAKNTWVKIDPMPTARHGLTAQAVRGGILVVGGGPQPGFTYSGVNELLDPDSAELLFARLNKYIREQRAAAIAVMHVRGLLHATRALRLQDGKLSEAAP